MSNMRPTNGWGHPGCWERWQKYPVKCEEMNLLDLNVKVKTEQKLANNAVKCEDEVLKCDKCEGRLPW